MHLQQTTIYNCIFVYQQRIYKVHKKSSKNGAAIHLGFQPLTCKKFQMVAARGGARNFGLGGPSYDVNILVKTNLYTHMYIN